MYQLTWEHSKLDQNNLSITIYVFGWFIYLHKLKTDILFLCVFSDACKAIGETCAKTIFDRCCDGTVCKLSAPFYGECVECLTSGNRCWKHSECCSGYCNWFTCRDL